TFGLDGRGGGRVAPGGSLDGSLDGSAHLRNGASLAKSGTAGERGPNRAKIGAHAGIHAEPSGGVRLGAMFGELIPREKSKAPFISIEEALEEIRRGRMIILM